MFSTPLPAACQSVSAAPATSPCQRTESPATVRVIFEPVSARLPLCRPLRPATEPGASVKALKPVRPVE